MYLTRNKLFNGIVITDIDLVQIDGVVDVVPHVVVMLYMVVKALYGGCNKIDRLSYITHQYQKLFETVPQYLSSSLKLMVGNTANKAKSLLVLLCTELHREQLEVKRHKHM